MSTEFNVEYSLGKVLVKLLKSNGIRPHLVACATSHPITENGWTMRLPDNDELKWNDKKFRLVIHAQDFVNWYEDCCLELLWLEQQFTPEQLEKVIFVHWDHNLQQVYQGPITCIEFPTHSYELVTTLKQNWSKWRHIPEEKDWQHNWLCLNGRDRPYRQIVYNLLRYEESGYVSHSIFNPVPHCTYHEYDFNNVGNFIKIGSVYQQAKVSIVTESIYADHPGIITEKTLLAIAAKHPFMCIGHKGIHKEIANKGFVNFSNLFNLEYDNEPSDSRLYSAIENNMDTLRSINDLDMYQEQIEHNFDFLMNDYLDRLYETARTQILAHLVQV